jgi:signal transduction histidine kinase/ActR/RegA family two-component response regulator
MTPDEDDRWNLTLGALEHLDQGLSVFDHDLRLVTCNKRYLELLDFPSQMSRVGTPFADFIRYNVERGEYGPGDPQQQFRERIESARLGERHHFERTRPDGTVLEINGDPLPDGGFVTVYTDVTERQRAQQALRRNHDALEARVAERTAALESLNKQLRERAEAHEQTQAALLQARKMEAVGQLTGGVAHDFNNLLTIIMGNLSLLEEDVGEDEELVDSVRSALGAARRGANLTGRLLAFSRRQPLRPQALSLNALVDDLGELLRRTLGENIRVRTRLDPDVWCTLADRHELENALLNLAINARDAMPSGGTLSIETWNTQLEAQAAAQLADARAGEYAVVCVRDTGFGMPPHVLERAFEPFFTTKQTGAGTGLGLSTVYGFVQQSGGHVAISSRVGGGTAVSIHLPRTSRPAETAYQHSDSPEQALRGEETVLLVEDDPEVRRFTARVLSELGYAVLEAGSVRIAMDLLERERSIALMLSDLVMPGPMSGSELVRFARERFPALHLMCMSGYADRMASEGAQLGGDCALISKPFQKWDLARAVRKVLDGKPRNRVSAPSR